MVPSAGDSPADRPVILVSACLLGVECNHQGRASRSEAVRSLSRDARLIGICPEVAGGLATPRPAAERQPDGRVLTGAGDDVTDAYARGAAHAVDLDEILTDENAVVIIEWGERLGHYPLPAGVWRIGISGDGDEPRKISISQSVHSR